MNFSPDSQLSDVVSTMFWAHVVILDVSGGHDVAVRRM